MNHTYIRQHMKGLAIWTNHSQSGKIPGNEAGLVIRVRLTRPHCTYILLQNEIEVNPIIFFFHCRLCLQYGLPGTATLDPSKTYKGMFDGIYKIAKYEGIRGLYSVRREIMLFFRFIRHLMYFVKTFELCCCKSGLTLSYFEL